MSNDPARVLAFYLPQFHPIPENDRWWGEGFTEWTNVRRATPQYVGHHQPVVPADLGYYDLREPEVLDAQAALARQYGIYGFCYYYYWFGGQRLLERPLEAMLARRGAGLPFCLCYANESWTRRWDGSDAELLMVQAHSPEDDLAFIRSLFPYFEDDRYIRIDGKPLLLVYRTGIFPDIRATAERWRDACRREGIGEIYLCRAETFGDHTAPATIGFDAAYEFPPHERPAHAVPDDLTHVASREGFRGVLHDYRQAARAYMARQRPDFPLFRGVMPAWDNTPRKQERANIFHGATPEGYGEWLTFALMDTQRHHPPSARYVFVNAWNEWAEGAYLEPCVQRGHANLVATRRALDSQGDPDAFAPRLAAFSARLDPALRAEFDALAEALARRAEATEQALASFYQEAGEHARPVLDLGPIALNLAHPRVRAWRERLSRSPRWRAMALAVLRRLQRGPR